MANSLRESLKGRTARRAPSHEDEQAFIAGAEREPVEPHRTWKNYNKKAVPRTTFNLRLNDYELGLLRWLAEERDESMQRVAKRVLIPALEQLANDTSL